MKKPKPEDCEHYVFYDGPLCGNSDELKFCESKEDCPIEYDIDWGDENVEIVSRNKCEFFYYDDSDCYCSHDERMCKDEDRCMKEVCPCKNNIKWE